jgi:hypothetical protein
MLQILRLAERAPQQAQRHQRQQQAEQNGIEKSRHHEQHFRTSIRALRCHRAVVLHSSSIGFKSASDQEG